MDNMRHCPNCQGTSVVKAIYCGAPILLCIDAKCETLFGWWSWVMTATPWLTNEDGTWSFLVYEGSYWKALWYWLTQGPNGPRTPQD